MNKSFYFLIVILLLADVYAWDVSGRFTATRWARYDPVVFGQPAAENETYYADLDGETDDSYEEYLAYCSTESQYNYYPSTWHMERVFVTPDKYRILIRGQSGEDCSLCVRRCWSYELWSCWWDCRPGQPICNGTVNVNPESGWRITEINKCDVSKDTWYSNEVVIPTWCSVDRDNGLIMWQAGSTCGDDGPCCRCDEGAKVDIDVVVERINGAEYIDHSVGGILVAGQSYAASVTFMNNGSTTWSLSGGYSPVFNSSVNASFWTLNGTGLYVNESIIPGNIKTFLYDLTPPSTAGSYTLDWGMYKEGYGSFGEKTPPIQVIVLSTTLPTSTTSSSTSSSTSISTTSTSSTTSSTSSTLYIKSVSFTYLARDDQYLNNCSLYIDITGTFHVYHIERGLESDMEYTHIIDGIPAGSYNWFVRCFDNHGQSAVSETRRFTVTTSTTSSTSTSSTSSSTSSTSAPVMSTTSTTSTTTTTTFVFSEPYCGAVEGTNYCSGITADAGWAATSCTSDSQCGFLRKCIGGVCCGWFDCAANHRCYGSGDIAYVSGKYRICQLMSWKTYTCQPCTSGSECYSFVCNGGRCVWNVGDCCSGGSCYYSGKSINLPGGCSLDRECFLGEWRAGMCMPCTQSTSLMPGMFCTANGIACAPGDCGYDCGCYHSSSVIDIGGIYYVCELGDWKKIEGSPCSSTNECYFILSCSYGFCCGIASCGYDNRCYATGASPPAYPYICEFGDWKKKAGEHCTSDDDCYFSLKCLSGVCSTPW